MNQPHGKAPDPSLIGYQPQLDGLRACAVSLVMLRHLHWLTGGFIGVDVFFVLSGFLITLLLIREREARGSISLSGFYLRRVKRLLPAVLLLCAVALGFCLTHRGYPGVKGTELGVLSTLFYASAWVRAFGVSLLGGMGQTWSLSVEEYFYFLWPALLIVIARRGKRDTLKLASIATAASVVYQVAASRDFQWSGYRIYFSPDTRADQLLIGCLLAVLVAYGGTWLSHRLVRLATAGAAAGAIVLLALDSVNEPWQGESYLGFGMVTIGVASACLILRLYTAPNGWLASLLASSPFRWVGQRSYGIYLWHFFLIWALGSLLATRNQMTVIVVPLTLAIAALSYRFLERPIRRVGFGYLLQPVRRLTAALAATR
jgi:peptidoglycan/LPS O-acetylase OafA/YrhL